MKNRIYIFIVAIVLLIFPISTYAVDYAPPCNCKDSQGNDTNAKCSDDVPNCTAACESKGFTWKNDGNDCKKGTITIDSTCVYDLYTSETCKNNGGTWNDINKCCISSLSKDGACYFCQSGEYGILTWSTTGTAPNGIGVSCTKRNLSQDECSAYGVTSGDVSKLEAGDSTKVGLEQSVGSEMTCDQIIGDSGVSLLKVFIVIVRILSVILLIALSASDFMKAIPSEDQDMVIKAWKKMGTRAIIMTLIVLLPTFLNIIGTLLGIFDSCGIW